MKLHDTCNVFIVQEIISNPMRRTWLSCKCALVVCRIFLEDYAGKLIAVCFSVSLFFLLPRFSPLCQASPQDYSFLFDRSSFPLSAFPLALQACGSLEFIYSCSAAGRDLRRDG